MTTTVPALGAEAPATRSDPEAVGSVAEHTNGDLFPYHETDPAETVQPSQSHLQAGSTIGSHPSLQNAVARGVGLGKLKRTAEGVWDGASLGAAGVVDGAVRTGHENGSTPMDIDCRNLVSGDGRRGLSSGEGGQDGGDGGVPEPEGMLAHADNTRGNDDHTRVEVRARRAEADDSVRPAEERQAMRRSRAWSVDDKVVCVLEIAELDEPKVAEHLQAVYAVFGEALLPWLPLGELSHVML
jgi:hypothetical protein